jgi:1-acyl-sn-glycerol-3-phosphate acyltransferase
VRSEAFRRRLVTIPRIVVLWLALTVLFVPLLLLTVTVDAVRFVFTRKPWMAVRLLAMGWVYLTGQVVVVSVAGVQWLASFTYLGNAVGKRTEWAYGLQTWWVRLIMGAMRRVLGLSFAVTNDEAIEPGPIIVLFRHVSIVDNLLPHAFVSDRHGIHLRWVLKKELLSDPALDIGGNRIPNYFVDRESDDPATERANIAALGEGLEANEGIMLFPEGTRFSSERREARMARLAESNPELHDIMAGHDHVLPPRPGGVLALLDSGMDVVFGIHTGLESMRGLSEIWNIAPIGRTVQLTFRRVAAADIPSSAEDRIKWLHEEWARVGDTITEMQSQG